MEKKTGEMKKKSGVSEKPGERPLLRISLKFGPLESTIDLLPEAKTAAQRNCGPAIEKNIVNGIVKSDVDEFNRYVESLDPEQQVKLLEKMAGTAIGVEEMMIGLGKHKEDSDIEFLKGIRDYIKKIKFSDIAIVAGVVITAVMSLYMYLNLKWKLEKIEEKLNSFI